MRKKERLRLQTELALRGTNMNYDAHSSGFELAKELTVVLDHSVQPLEVGTDWKLLVETRTENKIVPVLVKERGELAANIGRAHRIRMANADFCWCPSWLIHTEDALSRRTVILQLRNHIGQHLKLQSLLTSSVFHESHFAMVHDVVRRPRRNGLPNGYLAGLLVYPFCATSVSLGHHQTIFPSSSPSRKTARTPGEAFSIRARTCARFSGEVAAVSKYHSRSGCFMGVSSQCRTVSPLFVHRADQVRGVRRRWWLGSRSFST